MPSLLHRIEQSFENSRFKQTWDNDRGSFAQSCYLSAMLMSPIVHVARDVQHLNPEILHHQSTGYIVAGLVGYAGILAQKVLEKKSGQ